jgi:hypothetical protein
MIIREPYEKTVKRSIRKLVKQARYKDIDTGKIKVSEIIENGISSRVETPIFERVFMDAVFEDEEINQKVWIVETEFNGLVEEHEFNTEIEAKGYYGGG